MVKTLLARLRFGKAFGRVDDAHKMARRLLRPTDEYPFPARCLRDGLQNLSFIEGVVIKVNANQGISNDSDPQ